MARCLLCTSNDEQALIEHLTEKLWDSWQGAFEEATPWCKVGATRQ